MSDKSENCPVCLYELKNHTVQDLIDCIQKLFKKNEDNHTETNPTKIILTGNAKNQEALSVITDLLVAVAKIRIECDKDPNLNKLVIKYLLNQKELLEKLRDILI
jgi:galactitol-specific phosphotransferase system IIB component